ncbi:MAG: 23S rRNA (guanosine(2251)-2'-O)-methyltransferase RlmB [Fusobacteria bacterium]|nr:23S rRNA (guanosine(2251)-2'-O)-methyltransferase RlmB [Fusobacteriota bacterium]
MKKIIGINPVIEALKNNTHISKIEIYKQNNNIKIEEIIEISKKKSIKILFVEKKESDSQGVIAYIEEYDYEKDFGEFLEKIVKNKESTVLILDGIQDPRNFGAIIRSAECFGVDGIIIPNRNSVKINETVIKTSTGAIEYVDIVPVTNISQAIEQLKKIGYWIYGAEADGSKDFKKESYAEKAGVVLGSEGRGIRKKVKENCDILVKIPMKGKINSLNVSVACGILLSQISKK